MGCSIWGLMKMSEAVLMAFTFLLIVCCSKRNGACMAPLKTLAKSINHHIHHHPHLLFFIPIFSINHTHCSSLFHHLIHANLFSFPCTWPPPFHSIFIPTESIPIFFPSSMLIKFNHASSQARSETVSSSEQPPPDTTNPQQPPSLS